MDCAFLRSWSSLTRPLGSLSARHLPRAGAKAVTLGRMLRAGLPVPDGFVLFTDAFHGFVRSSPEWNALARAAAENETGSSSRLEAVSERVTRALADHPMPANVEEALARALATCPAASLWAVRSSATAEDSPGTSFAGQHDSFLNVAARDVPASVRACWLSLFTPRALHYRQRHHLRWDQAAMAVIVQPMVPAEIAGVLFTADPTSGNRNRIVIEAAPGLGEGLVRGRVEPEQMVLDRLTLAILKRSQPRTTAGGTEAPPGSGEKASPGLVSGVLAQRLATLALEAESLLGGRLDLEWAALQGEAKLLQARPITGVMKPESWEDRQVWTNLNTGEILPDVASPITWSMLQRLVKPLFFSLFRLVGADFTKAPTLGLVAGRVYFNVNTGLAAMKPVSFLLRRGPEIAIALGGGQAGVYQRLLSGMDRADLPDLGFRWAKYILSWPRIALALVRHSPRRGEAFSARARTRGDVLAREDFAPLSAPELVGAFGRVLEEHFADWDLLYLFSRAGALLVFEKACRDWLGDHDGSLASRLFAALGGLPDTEAGLALWRLAALAHAEGQTEALICSGVAWAELRPRLSQTPHGAQFLAAWDTFMAEHGHHCRGEVELFNARWSESPDYILDVVRSYLASVGQADPLENQKRLAREREALTRQCRERLTNPGQRWVFSHVLRRVQRLALDREVWKNEVVRRLAVLRRILLLLGVQLQRQGVLARVDDIFFLEVPEIEPVGTGRAPFDVRAVVSRRRQEYEANLELRPPPLVRGRFEPEAMVVLAAEPADDVLLGIAVFPGTVTGRARVILRADAEQQILAGEILVAPFTDPAWTPYFVAAAGVVVDQGGVLSHGSIIAREYGLPAVTNLGSATRVIRTGDLVRVDGQAGRVSILERGQQKKR